VKLGITELRTTGIISRRNTCVTKHRVRIQSLLPKRNYLSKISLNQRIGRTAILSHTWIAYVVWPPMPLSKIRVTIFMLRGDRISDSNAAGNEIV
jgi:hypothetical protein